MNKLTALSQLTLASLVGLIVLHTVMLLALFSGGEPSPPTFFGPFIGAMIAVTVFTIMLILCEHKYRWFSVLVVFLMALPGVGPQKVFTEPDILVLSPVVIFGTFCVGVLATYLFCTIATERNESVSWMREDNAITGGN